MILDKYQIVWPHIKKLIPNRKLIELKFFKIILCCIKNYNEIYY